MSSISALNTGLAGIQRGFDALDRDARQILKATTTGDPEPGHDLNRSLIYLKVDKLQTGSAARIVEVASNMIGSLLDIKA